MQSFLRFLFAASAPKSHYCKIIFFTCKWRSKGQLRALGRRPRPWRSGPSRTARRGVCPAGTPTRCHESRGSGGPRPRPRRPRTRAAGRLRRTAGRTSRPPQWPSTRGAATACTPVSARPVRVWPRSARKTRPAPPP